jgi:Ca-activated chloride channel homolog
MSYLKNIFDKKMLLTLLQKVLEVAQKAAFFLFFVFTQNLHAQNADHKDLINGDTQYDKKEYKKAEEHYRKAVEKVPENNQASYNLGNAVYQQGRHEQAISFFERAAKNAKSDAEKADAYHNLGNAYYKKNDLQPAVDAYRNSLRLRPKDAETKQNLRLATQKLEQQKKEQQKKEQEQQKNKDKQDPNQSNKPSDNPEDQKKDQPKDQPKPEDQKKDQSQNKAQQGQQKSQQEAKRLLETLIEPEDQKNGKKYRTQARQRQKPEKDW